MRLASILTAVASVLAVLGGSPDARAARGDHKCRPGQPMTKSLAAGGTTKCSTARKVERYFYTHPVDGTFRIDGVRFKCGKIDTKLYACSNSKASRKVLILTKVTGS